VEAENLADAVAQPLVVPVERGEPPDVDADEIRGRLACRDPLGECFARPAGGRDAYRVEARSHEEVPQGGGLAEDELVVRGEALRSVVELLDARAAQHR
jgi:hypothetical protein